MSMVANYLEADLKLIEYFMNKPEDELFERIDELNYDDKENVCYLDKNWDGVHFLLTSQIMGQWAEKSLLNIFIFGDLELSDEYIAIIKPDLVKKVAEKVNSLDVEELLRSFDPLKFEKAEIYGTWLEEDKVYIIEHFNHLRDFYNKVAKNDNGIIVSIF